MHLLRSRPSISLAAGVVLLICAQLRFGLGDLAWLYPLAFLHHLRHSIGRASKLFFALAFFAAWTIAVAKIVTAPLSLGMAPLFSLPIALAHGCAYIVWNRARGHLTPNLASALFAGMTVVGEWILHGFLPFGTWGALANTQLHRPELLQVASLTGLHGISFFIAFGAATFERLLARWSDLREDRTLDRDLGFLAFLAALLVLGGQLRLVLAENTPRETMTVAAIGTDSTVGQSAELPDERQLAVEVDGLLRRTIKAANAGARIVVWNEAATMVRPQNEDRFLARIADVSREHQIKIVAAYVVPRQDSPLRYDNKYAFFAEDGEIHHTYFKHEPVPGEPARKGEGPLPLFVDAQGTKFSGAICYDYDFPRLALEHASAGVDLVALPSSDWLGISPIHTEMAKLRAIEGGHSILRSTRFGLSAGLDPWGQIRGRMSHFDGEERILVVDLPQRGITTFYGRFGDWFPLGCAFLSLSILLSCWRRAKAIDDSGDSGVGGQGHANGRDE
jgi:apolipoprotein N-acyltransferase